MTSYHKAIVDGKRIFYTYCTVKWPVEQMTALGEGNIQNHHDYKSQGEK